MPSQTEAGKAFEYTILIELFDSLISNQKVKVKKDNSYEITKNCYNKFNHMAKQKYKLASRAAIQHLFDLEPRLKNPLSPEDNLELEIVPDSMGIQGDVRDILIIRRKHNWQIGISAKNQHKAVKHSRLSEKINFGKKWIGINCSNYYFSSIKPIFEELKVLRKENILWKNVKNKNHNVYVPILDAFKSELLRIDQEKPSVVPQKLLHYLIGNKDFYKVIKERNTTTIQGFNLNGTLNKSSNQIRPKAKVPRLKFPTRIVELTYRPNSTNTLILICNEGWQLSFRIHSASSKVESSLKFDINIEGHPQSLYTHRAYWENA